MRLIIIAICSFFLTIYGQDGWTLEKEKDGIKVYTKEVAGYRMKASKAIMIVDESPEVLLDIITDIEKYPDWIPSCEEGKMLSVINDKELVYYAFFDTPWPAASRDLSCYMKVEKKDNIYYIKMENRSDFIEHSEDAVRIPKYSGYWKLVPVEGGVQVINEYKTDPGGGVPDWLIQGAAVKEPMKNFVALKEYLENDYDRSSIQSQGY